ncbi:hypothetical protein PFLUV_G00119620 [Perca fluviatilis]|uniref:Ubiquitin-like protease family profile domain-containing protein n=1 Tax=Perca fluviatilis TaxID=8168 RepID=A0A6A5EZB8_PERFL|nr:hypothetical protein PFLUV_G00119620 [Perca fluviatilis]
MFLQQVIDSFLFLLCKYADIEQRRVIYMNSLGESKAKEQDILNNWSLNSSFATAWGCDGPWETVNVQHPMQTDGHSCGVHVILYAQALLHGEAVERGIVEDFGLEMSEIRAELCHDLFKSLGEKISAHVFRSLIGGRRANLPPIVLQQPPQKKTKTSIFSCLSEGEAVDLADGFAGSLAHNVHSSDICQGVTKDMADKTK